MFIAASIVASNMPSTRYAERSIAHEGASPIAASASAAPDARQDGDARTARARDEQRRPGRPRAARRSEAPATAVPSSAFVSPSESLIAGQPRQHRGGDRAMGEEQRADGDPGAAGARGIDGRRHGATHGAGCPAARRHTPRAARPGIAPPRDVSYRHSDA